MKKVFNKSLLKKVVKASNTTGQTEGFWNNSFLLPSGIRLKINEWKMYSILVCFISILFVTNAFGVSTLSCTTTQNGKNAIITCTLCPWTTADDDFTDPFSSDEDVVAIQSIALSTLTVNGVSCRQMIVQVVKKKDGNAKIEIHQAHGPKQDVEFKLFPELFSMAIPAHMNHGEFLSNGFHPGEVFQCMLKIIDTETGNDNITANGIAAVNIVGNGFSFNGGALAQTVNFINGVSTVTIYADQPNTGYCYFRISDDTLPGSIGGSHILHTAMVSLSSPGLILTCSTTGVSCNGISNGTVTMNVSGGTMPYVYACSNGTINSGNPTFTGLIAGTYTATVTDFYGASLTTSFTILPPPVLNIEAVVNQPYCSPGGLGGIQLSVPGTSSPISYLWNDGSSSGYRSNLSPGTYTVTATDMNGCNGSKTFNLSSVSQPPVMVCPSDITTTTEPGKNYAFVKYHLDVIESCTGYVDISCYPPSGAAFNKGITVVTCLATNQNGQSTTCNFNVIVNDDEAPVVNIDDAIINLNASGNATITSALLNDSSSDNCGIISRQITPGILSCSNVGTTAVTMTVTDGNNYYWVIDSNRVKYFNSSNVLLKTITTVGKPSVIVTSDGGFILIDLGRIRLYHSSGTLKSTIFTIGKVQVILTNDGGFIVIDDGKVRLYDKTGALKSTIFTVGNVQVIQTCDGGFIVIDDGRVRKYDKNGNLQSTIFTTGPVRVVITNDCGFVVIDDGKVRKFDKDGILQSTIFTTGAVDVITTNDGGFIVIDDGRVRRYDKAGNPLLTVFTTGYQEIRETCDGGIIIIDDGRVRKYDKNGNLQVTVLTPNFINVVLTPDCGFIVIENDKVSRYDNNGNLQAVIFTYGEVNVINTTDGGFIVTDDGRVRKYDKNGNLLSTNFTSGNKQIVVTADGGFIIIDDGRVRLYGSNGVKKVTIYTTGATSVVNICDGGFIVIDDGRVRKYEKDGNLQSTIFTTGNVQVIQTADCGFIVIDDGRVRLYGSLGNLKATIFTTGKVRVITDSNGGFKILDNGKMRVFDKDGTLLGTTFTAGTSGLFTNKIFASAGTSMITVLNPISIAATVKNIDCSGMKTGKITVTLSANTGPYTFLWSNGKTTKSITNLAAGTYTLTVNDANGCSNDSTFNVIQPASLVITTTKTTVTCNGAATGTAKATVSGGNPPYTYSWNTVPVKTTAKATGLSAGVYIVTVTDANGCSKTKSLTIIQNQPVSVNIQQSFDHATAFPSGGIGPYTFVWNTSPVQTNSTAVGLTCGNTYTVTVTDSKGCTCVHSFVLLCPKLEDPTGDNEVNINVFPNPTSGQLSINITDPDTEKYYLELIDMSGRIIYTVSGVTYSGNLMQLDLSAYADGIYSLRISADDKVKISKIILQKSR